MIRRTFVLWLTLLCLMAAALADSGDRSLPDGLLIQRDLEYGQAGNTSLKLDVIRSKRPSGKPSPAVIFLHGGSWSGGSKADVRWPQLRLAEHGYVLVSVDYRLSQTAVFPAQIEDCKCAVRWLRAHASEFGVDPQRIGAWGTSAGGHLAALLGTSAEATDLEGQGGWPLQSSRVQAVVDMFGPTDFTQASLATFSAPQLAKAPESPENPTSSVARLLGGRLSAVAEQGRRASPTTYVSRSSCPFLILHGDHDDLVPLQQSQLLAERLRQAGVEATLVVFPGGDHGLKRFQEQYYPQVERFLDQHLKATDRHLK